MYTEQSADVMALKESLNKIKLLEYDYNALQNKRLQDVSKIYIKTINREIKCNKNANVRLLV